MKWVKSKKELDSRRLNTGERKACYAEFNNPPIPSPGSSSTPPPIIKIGGKEYFHWVTHNLDISKHSHFDQKAKEEYEMFCGGWLQFYDHIVRNHDRDREIYFYWQQYEEVTIYIDERNALNKDYNIKLTYTPPPSDPPTPPAPPPPPTSV